MVKVNAGRSAGKHAGDGSIRIIAGKWRGRQIVVTQSQGLRPTPNRIRETLFNWLSVDLQNSICLDCFAGSGALGFEALSRGAGQLVMVESDLSVCRILRLQSEKLAASDIQIEQQDVLLYLSNCQIQFNLVFIDPPYAFAELRVAVILKLIEQNQLLNHCKLFIEWPDKEDFQLPDHRLIWLKQKTAGQVHYGIAQWQMNG